MWNTSNLRLLLVTGTMLTALLPAAAQTVHRDYGPVTHDFQLRPGGNLVPIVTVNYYCHAWVQEFEPACSNHDELPGVQPAGWNPLGRDYLRSRGVVRTRGITGGDATEANTVSLAIPAGGFAATTYTASAQGACASSSEANVSIEVDPFGAGTAVSGELSCWGFAEAVRPPARAARAYAFSMAAIQAQGGREMRNGRIRWGRVVRDQVSGSSLVSSQRDPIEFTVTDLVTGEVYQGTLLSIKVDARSSPAGSLASGFHWENDLVEFGADTDVVFEVDLTSPYTSETGYLKLVTENGQVTESTALGIYAGMLPAVGTPLPLTLLVPTVTEFDYDLGEFDGHELEVEINMNGGGEAEAEVGGTDTELAYVAMDSQINLDPDSSPAFNAITSPLGLPLEFYAGGAPELEGFTRLLLAPPGPFEGPCIDFNKAGIGPIDIGDPTTNLRVELRYYQDAETNELPYADAPIGLRLYDLADDGTPMGMRDYGLIYATQAVDAPYPTWTQSHVLLQHDSRPYIELGAFDPTGVDMAGFYGMDLLGSGFDFVDVKQLGVYRSAAQAALPGDLDCSGAVDFGDINPFVLALTSPSAYAAMFPGCPWSNGDIDGNGTVDFGDINPFVSLLTGGT